MLLLPEAMATTPAVKAMTRKAHCHFWMKEYHKALEWYQKALESEPENEGPPSNPPDLHPVNCFYRLVQSCAPGWTGL